MEQIQFHSLARILQYLLEAISSQFHGEIFTVMNGKLQPMTMNKLEVRRIVNSYQNSAVLIEENSAVKVAEIFSFTPSGSIDANIAVKNLEKQKETYLVSFSVAAHKQANAIIGGYGNEFTTNVGGPLDVSIIPASDTSLQVGNLSINWEQSMSIFHMGSIHQNGLSDLITIPFGTFNLGANDTYSIDPVISYLGSISPGRTIPCPGCGGGGGGGGGGKNYPPVVSSDHLTNDFATTNLSTTLKAVVNPAGGATISFQLLNYSSNNWNTVYSFWSSLNGDYHFQDTLSYSTLYTNSAYEVRVVASNSYGTSYGNALPVTFANYMRHHVIVKVFGSNGNVVAEYTMAAEPLTGGKDYTYYAPDTSSIIVFAGTYVDWASNSGISTIWSFNQEISYLGEYGFTANGCCDSPGFDVTNVQDSLEGGINQTLMKDLMYYLANIANSFVFGLIPSPKFFFNTYGGQQSPTSLPIYFNDSGWVNYRTGQAYPLSAENGSALHEFGIETWNDVALGLSSTNWVVLLKYSVSISFFRCGESSSATMGIAMNVENSG